jgi:prevent-host-death family protein
MAVTKLTISAAEANRSFSKLLRAAKDGARVTITSHGQPVAELGPVSAAAREAAELERRHKAAEELRERWRTVTPVVIGPWRREDLYDRD